MVINWNNQLRDYLNNLVPQRPPELQVMEAYAKEHHFPIIGPASGQFCYQMTRLIGAKRVFELGSGYGYSTAWFAKGVRDNGGGQVYHVVWHEGLSNQAKGHLGRLGFDAIVSYIVDEAVQVLREVDGLFDLIFMDINKDAYPAALPVITEKLRPGGVLIVDNMLWSGRIFDQTDQSPATAAIREFTQLITDSPNWIVSLAPIGDGLILATRI